MPAQPLEIIFHLIPASMLEASVSHPSLLLLHVFCYSSSSHFVFMKFSLQLMPITTTLRCQTCLCFGFPESRSFSITTSFGQNLDIWSNLLASQLLQKLAGVGKTVFLYSCPVSFCGLGDAGAFVPARVSHARHRQRFDVLGRLMISIFCLSMIAWRVFAIGSACVNAAFWECCPSK